MSPTRFPFLSDSYYKALKSNFTSSSCHDMEISYYFFGTAAAMYNMSTTIPFPDVQSALSIKMKSPNSRKAIQFISTPTLSQKLLAHRSLERSDVKTE